MIGRRVTLERGQNIDPYQTKKNLCNLLKSAFFSNNFTPTLKYTCSIPDPGPELIHNLLSEVFLTINTPFMIKKIKSIADIHQITTGDILIEDSGKKFVLKSINPEFIRLVPENGQTLLKILPLENLIKEGWSLES
jgi:hypothetical protein